MFSLALTRWLMGYVEFSVLGGSLERFLNQCARAGIYLWDIRGGANCGASVAAGRYRELRVCARRAGCRLRAGKRHGFPFATRGLRKRRGILVGAAVAAAVLFVLSMNVWSVEVAGNKAIPTAEIKAELYALGVRPGAPKRSIEPLMLQHALMLKFPQISWLSVNTRGCAVEVRLQEKAEKPPMETKDVRPVNIKAAYAGQIVSLEVYAGTPMVKEGDAVVEGQLLISGIVENETGPVSLKRAAGKVMAETSRTMTAEVELRRSVTKPTGRVVTQRSLRFLGVRVPLSLTSAPEGNYRSEGVYTKLRLMSAVLPLDLYQLDWVEERTVAVAVPPEQARREAEGLLQKKQKEEMRDAEILSSGASDTVDGTRLIFTRSLKCRENIARESEILIN